MLLASRTAHLAQFDFAVSDRYSYEEMHTASADLSTRHHIKLDVVTCAEMSPSRLPNDAV